jgi:hypothetical protein
LTAEGAIKGDVRGVEEDVDEREEVLSAAAGGGQCTAAGDAATT